MSKVIKYMPELQGDEQLTIARIMTEMTEEQAEQFSRVYRQRRKDENARPTGDAIGPSPSHGAQLDDEEKPVGRSAELLAISNPADACGDDEIGHRMDDEQAAQDLQGAVTRNDAA